MRARFERLRLHERVRPVTAVATAGDARIGRALSHRHVVRDAMERGLRAVLVVEDETLFLDRADAVLAAAVKELRGRAWRLLYLGDDRGGEELAPAPGCAALRDAGTQVAPYAVAYSAAVYDDMLAAAPGRFADMQKRLGADGSIETILAALAPALVVHPAIATVPARLPFQTPEDQERFVP
jgi:hypothetical protein